MAAVNKTPEERKEGQNELEEVADAKEKLSNIKEEAKEENKNKDEDSP